MPTNKELIEQNLSILEDFKVLSRERHDEIMTALNAEPTTFEQYSESMSVGLPGVTQGVIDLIYASESADPFAISIASLGIFQGFTAMAGPMLGPAGPLVSALTGMLTTILGQFLPPPPSLKEEIEEVLNKFQAQEKKFDLGSAEDQISIFIHTLETNAKEGKPTAWKPLELLDGEQVKAIDAAWQWLSEREKQSLPYWGEMLSLTCQVFAHLLRAVTVSVAYPSKIGAMYTWVDEKGVTQKVTPGELMNVHLQSRCEKLLEKARRIKPVAQNRGMVFHLSTKGGELFAGDHIEEGTYARLGGISTAVSVAVSQKEMGSEDPVYHLLRLKDYPAAGSVWHRKLSSPYNETLGTQDIPQLMPWLLLPPGEAIHRQSQEFQQRVKDLGVLLDPELSGISDVWGMVGGDHHLDTNPPAKSIGTEKGRNRIYFYTAKDKNTINGYVRDEKGAVTKIYGRGVTGPELKWVRVVQCPEPVVGDPDDKIDSTELPGILRNIDYVVYGGCPPGKLYIDSRRSPRGKDRILKNAFVQGPWGVNWYHGLGVDQRYVWLHAPLGFACATHASVMRCLEGKLETPTWMYHQMDATLPKGKEDPKGKILDLCPGDDGSFLVSLTEGDPLSTDGAPLYSAAYHVNLKTRHIAVHWARDRSGAPQRAGEGIASYRSCKVPLFCWPQLEGLIEFVEETYPEHAAQAHTR
jgi:hypothetical protein